jgi:hypothetical protein
MFTILILWFVICLEVITANNRLLLLGKQRKSTFRPIVYITGNGCSLCTHGRSFTNDRSFQPWDNANDTSIGNQFAKEVIERFENYHLISIRLLNITLTNKQVVSWIHTDCKQKLNCFIMTNELFDYTVYQDIAVVYSVDKIVELSLKLHKHVVFLENKQMKTIYSRTFAPTIDNKPCIAYSSKQECEIRSCKYFGDQYGCQTKQFCNMQDLSYCKRWPHCHVVNSMCILRSFVSS